MEWQVLNIELTTDPLTRGYGTMSDLEAANDLNTIYRPNVNSIGSMVEYLLNKKHRTNQGGDTTFTPIIGRLYEIARSSSGDDPFARGTTLDNQHIHACQNFITLFESPYSPSMNFEDANLPYGFVEASGAWSTTHTAALKALSQNQQSRAAELGLRRVREGDVTQARAL